MVGGRAAGLFRAKGVGVGEWSANRELELTMKKASPKSRTRKPRVKKAPPQRPMTSREFVEAERKASEKFMKKVLKSKASARAYLVRAGILDKSGKLAKPYR